MIIKGVSMENNKKAWEILNEQKEAVLNIIKENPKILDNQILKPEIIYPNLSKYEVKNSTNNLILSTVAMDKRYADNTWIMADTVSNAKYEENGEKKPVFYLKKGEKATKIGIKVMELSKQDPVTGMYYKEKLDKPYTKNVNVFNISQFKFAKNIYPKKTYIENKKKDFIELDKEKIDKLSRNTFEAKLEKFFIEQQYNIKNKEEITPINPEELRNNIENSKTHDGKLHENHFRIEYFPEKAKDEMEKDLKGIEIEKNTFVKENKKISQKQRKSELEK